MITEYSTRATLKMLTIQLEFENEKLEFIDLFNYCIHGLSYF